MNLEKRFEQLRNFLEEYQFLHELEVLERYPLKMGIFDEWAQEMKTFTKDQLIQFENSPHPQMIKDPEFKLFIEQIHKLQHIPKKQFNPQKIPQSISQKMSLKKQHEIGVIKEEIKDKKIKHLIDIGSGAGHLSSYLLWDSNLKSLCIDQSSEFQKIGKKKLSKYHPDILERLSFQTCTFTPSTPLESKKHGMIIGLHACGDLTPIIIKKFIDSENEYLLSYGCCFHKLTPQYINLSKQAKESPLILSNHSLTLAAKGYKPKTSQELTFRDQVKKYRYGLHIYLKDHKALEFASIGNALRSDYEGPFYQYAHKYAFDQLKDVSQTDLENFIHDPRTLEKINRLIYLGIIRSFLARLIEVYIVIDRALYLSQQGFEIYLQETFDRKLSPRNLSLGAKKMYFFRLNLPHKNTLNRYFPHLICYKKLI